MKIGYMTNAFGPLVGAGGGVTSVKDIRYVTMTDDEATLEQITKIGFKGRCLGILFGAMSYTVIDKIIVSLKMDSLINNAIKGMILLIVIMIQVAGPKIRGKLK